MSIKELELILLDFMSLNNIRLNTRLKEHLSIENKHFLYHLYKHYTDLSIKVFFLQVSLDR